MSAARVEWRDANAEVRALCDVCGWRRPWGYALFLAQRDADAHACAETEHA